MVLDVYIYSGVCMWELCVSIDRGNRRNSRLFEQMYVSKPNSGVLEAMVLRLELSTKNVLCTSSLHEALSCFSCKRFGYLVREQINALSCRLPIVSSVEIDI